MTEIHEAALAFEAVLWLHWLAQHEAENLLVQFVNVPRLVSVFFQEMGISEFAEVSVSHK